MNALNLYNTMFEIRDKVTPAWGSLMCTAVLEVIGIALDGAHAALHTSYSCGEGDYGFRGRTFSVDS